MQTSTLVLALTLVAASYPELPNDRAPRLARGEVVVATSVPEGSNAVLLVAEAVIDAPPERVWALVEACDGYAKTMPRIKASKELSRKGNIIRCHITADTPFPLPNLESTTHVVHTVGEGRFERTWKLVEGDYHQNEGRWVLERFAGDDGRTLARYEITLEPKLSAPRSLVEAAQARTVPAMFQSLREHTRAAPPAP